MPGFDGTGPLGQGPMTGRGRGFCVLTSSKENPGQLEGLAGLQGRPISQKINGFENTGKKVIGMPFVDGTSPAGLGPMTGRAGYSVPYAGWANPWFRRGFGYGRGFGRSWGRGRGRGRFGYW